MPTNTKVFQFSPLPVVGRALRRPAPGARTWPAERPPCKGKDDGDELRVAPVCRATAPVAMASQRQPERSPYKRGGLAPRQQPRSEHHRKDLATNTTSPNANGSPPPASVFALCNPYPTVQGQFSNAAACCRQRESGVDGDLRAPWVYPRRSRLTPLPGEARPLRGELAPLAPGGASHLERSSGGLIRVCSPVGGDGCRSQFCVVRLRAATARSTKEPESGFPLAARMAWSLTHWRVRP